MARSFRRDGGACGGVGGAKGRVLTIGDVPVDMPFFTSSNDQIPPGCDDGGHVRGGDCHAGWQHAETVLMSRYRMAGCAVPVLPPQHASPAPPRPSAIGFKPSSTGSSWRVSGSADVSIRTLQQRFNTWPHGRPNAVGATQVSAPNIRRNAPVQFNMRKNGEDSVHPTTPPALSCGLAPEVKALSMALALSAASITSWGRTVP